MKKYSIYGLASLFALSFAACDNYEEPNPRPQTNPQEPVLAVSDVVVTQDVSADAAYDLKALNDEGKIIFQSQPAAAWSLVISTLIVNTGSSYWLLSERFSFTAVFTSQSLIVPIR